MAAATRFEFVFIRVHWWVFGWHLSQCLKICPQSLNDFAAKTWFSFACIENPVPIYAYPRDDTYGGLVWFSDY